MILRLGEDTNNFLFYSLLSNSSALASFTLRVSLWWSFTLGTSLNLGGFLKILLSNAITLDG